MPSCSALFQSYQPDDGTSLQFYGLLTEANPSSSVAANVFVSFYDWRIDASPNFVDIKADNDDKSIKHLTAINEWPSC